MSENTHQKGSGIATVIYNLLNPIPYGFFVAGLLFDIVYVYSANVMWTKSASWLILIGLLFAIIPRIINLVQVWFSAARRTLPAGKIDFWLNLIAIISAIVNCFVHARDAYAVVPQAVIYSAVTVICLLLANMIVSARRHAIGGAHHE